jgi:hypothetical protein
VKKHLAKSPFLTLAQLVALAAWCVATPSKADLLKTGSPIGSKSSLFASGASSTAKKTDEEPEEPLSAGEREIMIKHPESELGRYYTARWLGLQNRPAASYKAYLALKREFYSGKRFPYEQELADQAEKARIWSGALAAYRNSLSDPELSKEDRAATLTSIQEIRSDHAPELEMETDFDFLDEGTIWRSEGNFAWDITDALRGLVRVHADDVYLKSTENLRGCWNDREEAVFGLESAISDEWTVNGWLGGSTGLNTDNVLTGFHVERSFGDENWVSLEGALNERCTESVLDEAINGRQNRIGLEGNYEFCKGLMGQLSVNGIQYRIDDSTLGSGFDGEYSLDRQLCSQYPGLMLSVRGEVSTFNQSGGNPAAFNPVLKPIPNAAALTPAQLASAENSRNQTLLGDLVAPTDRHGLAFTVKHHFSSMLTCRLVNGVDYDFELNKVEYNVLGGLSVFPRDGIEVALDAGYTSAGQGANDNSPETVVSLTVRTLF